MLKKFIISPPFGTYINHPEATSVLGTFTRFKRPGKFKQVIKTLRYTKQGWVNKIGLKNPGIDSIKLWHLFKIYSINGSAICDWGYILNKIPNVIPVELNISCPNYLSCPNASVQYNHNLYLTNALTSLKHYSNNRKAPIIVKASPLEKLDTFELMHDHGIRYFHISNTLPTDRGGLSGRKLQEYTLPLIESVKRGLPDAKIIGGGGIYNSEDLRRYEDAGADHFSLATVWFTPWRALKLLTIKD